MSAKMTYELVTSFPSQGSGSVPSVVGPVKVPLSEILDTYLLQGRHHLADPGDRKTCLRIWLRQQWNRTDKYSSRVLGSLTTRPDGALQGHLRRVADERRHRWVHHGGGREELVPANHHCAEVQLLQ